MVDLISNGQAQGDVAGQLLAMGKLSPGKMRPWMGNDGKPRITIYMGGDPSKKESYKTSFAANATLMKEEWMRLDQAVVGIAESRLNGVQDLISRGLTYTIGNGLGTTVLESQTISDAMDAEMSMDGVKRGKGDRQKFGTVYLPLPIIHVDYDINTRVLDASRSLGNPLDTTQAERASRRVAEKLESMLFTDTNYSFGGGTIYSYVNYPDRNQVSLSTAWDDSSMTGAKIVADVLKMKQKSIDNLHYGPWQLYIPTGYETLLDEDYDNTRGNTTRERILAIAGVEGIKVVDTLPDDNVLMVEMQSDTVRLVQGLPIQNVEWNSEGGMITHYKVMAIQVPQIRSDYNNKTGIVHMA